jgi:hypothetical protein
VLCCVVLCCVVLCCVVLCCVVLCCVLFVCMLCVCFVCVWCVVLCCLLMAIYKRLIVIDFLINYLSHRKLWYGHTNVDRIDWKKEAYNYFFK